MSSGAQCLCLVMLATAASAENFTWLGLAVSDRSTQPPARHSAAMGARGGHLYLFGGQGNKKNGTTLLGDLWRVNYKSAELTWDLMSLHAPKPTPRHSTVYGVMDKYLIVSHGRGETESDLFVDTWALDVEDKDMLEWKRVNTMVLGENGTDVTRVPEGRIDAAGGMWGNLLWLSMGRNKAQRTLSDLWVLNITVSNHSGEVELFGEWKMLDEGVGYNQYDLFLPHARYKHAGAPLSDTKFVFFGGCASGGYVGGPCPLGDSWAYDRSEGKWTRLEDCSSPINDGALISLSMDRGLLVMGDEEDGPGAYPQLLSAQELNTSDLSVVDADNETWVVTQAKGSAFPSKRANPAIARDGTIVLVFGGRAANDKDVVMADLWRLTWIDEAGEPSSCPGGDYFSFVHLHGVLMYLAWGLLLPLSVLLNRYYKACWPFWFILHIIVQSLGMLMTVAGFVLIFLVGSYDEPNFAHAIAGIVLTVMLLHHFIVGIFCSRPCQEHQNGVAAGREKKRATRRCCEVYLETSGFLTIALGFVEVTLGVFLVVPPFEVWVTWCVLGCAWILTFLVHEVVFIIYKICKRVKND